MNLSTTDDARTFGITRLADLTGLDVIGMPVWSAVRPGAWSFAQSQGKGVTAEQAQRSALMEARETALAEAAHRLAVCHGTAPDLANQGAIDPGLCLSCTKPDLAARTAYPWLPGTGLRTGTKVLIPLPLVSLDFRQETAPGMRPFLLGSSGLAAHADRPRALRHALLEAVETDALALSRAWPGILDAAPAPRLAPDPLLDRLIASLSVAGVVPAFRDITSDIGLPVVLCWLTEPGAALQRARPFAGSACRLTLEEAARDALLEAVQSRLTDISGAREDIRATDYKLDPTGPNDPPSARPTPAYPSLARPAPPQGPKADLALILSRLAAVHEAEPLAVDLAPDRTDMACVVVIVPGLETGAPQTGHRSGPRARARRLRYALGLP